MGCRQWLSLSVVQLKGKHCPNPIAIHYRNGVVDTFEQMIKEPQIDNQTQFAKGAFTNYVNMFLAFFDQISILRKLSQITFALRGG